MQSSIDQILEKGNAALNAGNWQDAERAYQAILQSQPNHPEANHNLGLIAMSVNQIEAALLLFKTALDVNSKVELFWMSYIDALVKNNQVEDAKRATKKAKKRGFNVNKLQALVYQSKGETDNKVPSRELLNSLLEHYQSGRLSEAEKLAVSVTQEFPKHQFSWKVLGAVFGATGRMSKAIDANQTAVALSPQDADAHNNLGVTLEELERLDEAEASYRLAIKVKSDYAGAHYNLGIMLQKLGRLEEAEASYKQAMVSEPDYAEVHFKLGTILQELGRHEEAEASYNQAIELRPDHPEAQSNLGTTLESLGRVDEALASYIQAIALKPDFAEAHNYLGNTLKALGRLDEAQVSYRKAIALKSEYPEAHFNLGSTLQELGRLVEAEVSYTQAIILKFNYPEAHNDLGITLKDSGRFDKAELGFRQAIELKPDFAEAYSNLGNTLSQLGRFDEAEASHRRAIALKPNFYQARSNLLFLRASMRFDVSGYLTEAQGFADIVAEQISAPYSTWSRCKSPTKLRVGFVSDDFKQHPVGFFLEGLLVQLQSSSIELYAYPTNNPVGEITDRLKVLFHSWKSLAGKSNKDAAQSIHNDGVHILIDLSGHTAGNRLAIFGWRPAPIQITWLGYFGSTGLPEMDYILGDPFVTPQSEAHHFTEKIWQLPESYLCFTPPNRNLAVCSLPALNNDFLTFGCFNNLSKMTDEVVSVRADILHAVPNSKLFLKDKQLGYQSSRDRVLSRFASFGIAEHRLILEGKSSREEYLACYHRVDIALSPFPYGGGTTSVEGLWMGVPVITKKGNHFLSHLGESIAHNSNLSDWIAEDSEDYIAKAIEFSSDLSALEMLRHSLRENLPKTPLFDLPRFANNFEKALWEMRDSINL